MRAGRFLGGGAALLFVAGIGGAAALTAYRLGHWAVTDGPNTVGEAGKVYFAERFAAGEPIFARGDTPPYYPSTHGALLHASVGLVGRWLELPGPALYGVGRAITLAATVLALGAAGGILARLGGQAAHLAPVAALLFASEPIVAHAVSYRADHWNLALSAGACLLLLARPRPWLWAALAAVPVVAFLLKAPGALLAAPIVLGFWITGRRREALLSAAVTVALALAAAGFLQVASDGAWLDGLTHGLAAPVALRNALLSAGPVKQWLPWLAGTVSLAVAVRDPDADRRWWVVGAFFLTALVSAGGAAMRSGSNSYYFVEATLYGSVLAVAGFARARRRARPLAPALLAIAALASLLHLRDLPQRIAASVPVTDRTPMDISVRINRQVGGERRALAETIRANGWRCFSDDPGLNALLDEPAILYPWLASEAVGAGRLELEELLAPLRRGEFDLVVLTGLGWSYRGTPNLHPELRATIAERYAELPAAGGGYRILRPRGLGPEVGT